MAFMRWEFSMDLGHTSWYLLFLLCILCTLYTLLLRTWVLSSVVPYAATHVWQDTKTPRHQASKPECLMASTGEAELGPDRQGVRTAAWKMDAVGDSLSLSLNSLWLLWLLLILFDWCCRWSSIKYRIYLSYIIFVRQQTPSLPVFQSSSLPLSPFLVLGLVSWPISPITHHPSPIKPIRLLIPMHRHFRCLYSIVLTTVPGKGKRMTIWVNRSGGHANLSLRINSPSLPPIVANEAKTVDWLRVGEILISCTVTIDAISAVVHTTTTVVLTPPSCCAASHGS